MSDGKPVIQGKWYFYTNSWDLIGPYDTEEQASINLITGQQEDL